MSDYLWQTKRKAIAPDLTPMVDVVFQLIVFLVLMANFSDQPAIDLKLPEAGTSALIETATPRVFVSRAGELFWNTERIADLQMLRGRLGEYREQSSSREVQVMGDRGVDYGAMVSVIDACRAEGLTDLILGMEKTQQ